MNKVALVLTAVVLAGFGAVKRIGHSATGVNQRPIDPRCAEEQIRKYESFRETMDETLDALGKGKLSLRQATRQVLSEANENNPAYLASIHSVGPDDTIEARVARNLVGHIRRLAEGGGPIAQSRLRELEGELRNFVPK